MSRMTTVVGSVVFAVAMAASAARAEAGCPPPVYDYDYCQVLGGAQPRKDKGLIDPELLPPEDRNGRVSSMPFDDGHKKWSWAKFDMDDSWGETLVYWETCKTCLTYGKGETEPVCHLLWRSSGVMENRFYLATYWLRYAETFANSFSLFKTHIGPVSNWVSGFDDVKLSCSTSGNAQTYSDSPAAIVEWLTGSPDLYIKVPFFYDLIGAERAGVLIHETRHFKGGECNTGVDSALGFCSHYDDQSDSALNPPYTADGGKIANPHSLAFWWRYDMYNAIINSIRRRNGPGTLSFHLRTPVTKEMARHMSGGAQYMLTHWFRNPPKIQPSYFDEIYISPSPDGTDPNTPCPDLFLDMGKSQLLRCISERRPSMFLSTLSGVWGRSPSGEWMVLYSGKFEPLTYGPATVTPPLLAGSESDLFVYVQSSIARGEMPRQITIISGSDDNKPYGEQEFPTLYTALFGPSIGSAIRFSKNPPAPGPGESLIHTARRYDPPRGDGVICHGSSYPRTYNVYVTNPTYPVGGSPYLGPALGPGTLYTFTDIGGNGTYRGICKESLQRQYGGILLSNPLAISVATRSQLTADDVQYHDQVYKSIGYRMHRLHSATIDTMPTEYVASWVPVGSFGAICPKWTVADPTNRWCFSPAVDLRSQIKCSSYLVDYDGAIDYCTLSLGAGAIQIKYEATCPEGQMTRHVKGSDYCDPFAEIKPSPYF